MTRAVWQRWCAGCGGVALVSDLSDLSDLSDKVVRQGITRGCAVPLGGGARGGRFTAGVCGQLDGNGGARAAGVWRLLMDLVDLMDLMDKMGAPRDTPRVCSAAVGWDAGGRFTAGVCFACLIATVVCRLRRRGACVGPVGPV